MYYIVDVPEGYHYETGECPNAGHPCNCIGMCRSELVKDENCKCGGTGIVKRQPLDITSFQHLTRNE